MDATFSGKWEPAHQLRRETFLEKSGTYSRGRRSRDGDGRHGAERSLRRADRVVPFRADIVGSQIQAINILPRDLLALRVYSFVKNGLDGQARRCGRSSDVAEHDRQRAERFPCPVIGDLTEQSVLDRVPFGTTRRVMAYRHSQTERVANFLLQVPTPGS